MRLRLLYVQQLAVYTFATWREPGDSLLQTDIQRGLTIAYTTCPPTTPLKLAGQFEGKVDATPTNPAAVRLGEVFLHAVPASQLARAYTKPSRTMSAARASLIAVHH